MNVLTTGMVPSGFATIFEQARQLTTVERLMLAKLLLDSVLTNELSDEADWSALSLSIFQKDWDNPEDAIYDDWRKHYGVSEGRQGRNAELI